MFHRVPRKQPGPEKQAQPQLAAVVGSIDRRIAAVHRELEDSQRTLLGKIEDLDTRLRLLTYSFGQLDSLVQSLKAAATKDQPDRQPDNDRWIG